MQKSRTESRLHVSSRRMKTGISHLARTLLRESQSHDTLPILDRRLQCCDETPEEDDGSADEVWGKDFPEEEREFEDDVADVKDCKKLFVAVTN